VAGLEPGQTPGAAGDLSGAEYLRLVALGAVVGLPARRQAPEQDG
jgi:hypothetical protein